MDLYKGHGEGYDYLLSVHDDGTHELAIRPGKDLTAITWSPPVTLHPEHVETLAEVPD